MHSLTDWTPQKCIIKGYNCDFSGQNFWGLEQRKGKFVESSGRFPMIITGFNSFVACRK